MWRKPSVLFVATGLCLMAGLASGAPFAVKINFQLAVAQVPEGYLPDSGLAFGDRGNGYTYGWSRDISADSRDRANANADQRLDTLIHFQKGVAAVWEIVLPNGAYILHWVSGDPTATDQTNSFDVEGVIVNDPDGSAAGDNYDEFDLTVTVKDGRLTFQSAPTAVNSKICYIDIVSAKAPGTATDPVPAKGAMDIPRDVTLGWTAGDFAQTHNVYLGTDQTDVNNASVSQPLNVLVSQGQTETTYAAGALAYGKTYYWRVDEVNAPPTSTIFKGDVWSFTVEPYAYPITKVTATASSAQPSMGPENTVNGVGLNTLDQHSTDPKQMWLSTGVQPNWIQYQFDKAYKLSELWVWNSNQPIEAFVGFGAKSVKIEYSLDGATWTELTAATELAQGPGLATYTPNTTVNMGGVSAQYVKLTITASWGGLGQTGLSEVRFFYVPVQARMPQPAAQATAVDLATTLTWSPGREAASHKVYLGTDQSAVANGTVSAQTVTDHSFSPTGLLYGTTYYWKVDEVNAVTYAGDVWSFTTTAFGVVDDFESYNDDNNRIYDTWWDGYADSSSGSTVGNLNAPFAEQTIVHGGKQSMPVIYENIGKFSFSEAVLTLGGAQNWTANGVKRLSLYFRGVDGNTGQLYLKINTTKVAYNGDATDIAKAVWLAWNIDLSTVSGANKVTKLTIGVEGAGSKGTLYIDDIRLYPTAAVAATAPIITGVLRTKGQSGTRTDASPLLTYTGESQPVSMQEGGLKDGALVFSDRPYPWALTPAEMVGAEYVLMFNTDKNAGETDVTYTVVLSRAVTVFLTCDDRIVDQQAAVDKVVAAFAQPGQFKKTGLKLYVRESATVDRPMSLFSADLPAGTYVFGAQDSTYNFYTILAKDK